MMSEERARQAASRRWAAAGTIVVWDRDFFADNYARDVRSDQRSVGQRLHGAYLTHRYRRPDLMIVLDAPPSALFERQGEGTLPDLAGRRQEYLDIAGSSGDAIVVDADRAVGDVADAVMDLVMAHLSRPTTDEAPVSSHH
jgi:thymidylate kinase